MSHTELRKTSSLCPQQRALVADRDATYGCCHTFGRLRRAILRLREAILSLAIGTGLLVPASAFAYLSPEQVFGGSSLTLQPAPPTQREGQDVVSLRQQQSAARRAEEQKSLTAVHTPSEDTYVPDAQPVSRGLFDQDAQYQLRMQRKQEASPGAQVIILGPHGEVLNSGGNVLRSGAPLVTTTGPETVLVLILLLLATLSTAVYVRERSRIMHLAV